MANSRTKDFREAIAKEFIASLQEETKEWHKTWRSGIYRPQNINGSNYKGINYILVFFALKKDGRILALPRSIRYRKMVGICRKVQKVIK